MDNNGIPIAYDLFPGNESEKLQILQPVTNINNKIIKIIFSSLFYLM